MKKCTNRVPVLNRALLLISLIVVISAETATAQEPSTLPDRRLSVHDAIELADTHNPELNQVRQELRSKDGEWWRSFGINSPELSYMKEGIPTGNSTGGGGFVEQRWTVSQSIDFPLQSYYRLRQIDKEEEALLLKLDARSTKLKAAIKRIYTDLLYRQELVHLRQQELSLARQISDAATARIEVGEASELELMKAEIQSAAAETNLEEALREFQNARYSLFNVVGLDPEEQAYEVVFPDTLVYVDVDIDQTLVMGHLGDQPELLSVNRSMDAARLGIKQTNSALLPAIRFDIYTQDYGTGFDQMGFQIGLKIPLWIIPNHKGNISVAKAEELTWQWRRDAVELNLKKEAEVAWHGYETSKHTIDRYRATVEARSNELLRLTFEGYRVGELDLLTLLDAQRTYLSGQQSYYDALRQYYYQLIDLERFLGEDIVFQETPTDSSGDY